MSLTTTSTVAVSTFAGSSWGYADGQGTAAQLSSPNGLTIDSVGNFYVADTFNNRIRKITPSGLVSTFAGSSAGFLDGQGTAAQFYRPSGVAIDSSGNLYVADTFNNRIRKITSSGLVSTFAGSGTAAYLDGQGTAAQFYRPSGVAVDSGDNVYVADRVNHKIRKITPDGLVSTFAGSSPGSLDGQGTAARFYNPYGVAIDSGGNLYVADGYNDRIRKITTSCSQPTGTQYVTATCTSTTDTVFLNSPTCNAGQFLMGFTPGSSTALGSPGTCTTCSQPTGTQYVTATCTSTTNTVFSNSPTCTTGSTFLTGFTPGSSSSLGSPGTCGACNAGTYNNNGVCEQCPTGLFSAASASICSAACPVGTLSVIGSACLNTCPAGKWYNSTLLQCNTCPSGTFYVGPGATSMSDCVSCGRGTYSGIGSPSCLNCPVGTSFNGSRGTSDAVCTPCPAGQYSNVMGSATCSVCPSGTGSGVGSSFCYKLITRVYHSKIRTYTTTVAGIGEDRGNYIIHTITTRRNVSTLETIDIYDELVITATNVYSKGPRTLAAATYNVDPNQITNGLLDRGSVYTTDYGVFQSGTAQYVIVYLKTPCPASTPKWDPLQKKCVAACSVPVSSATSNVCTKCSTLTDVRSIPVAGAAFCEPGFTLSGTTCNGTSLTCPDQSWTLSSSLCTKTEMRCPTGSILMPQNYCLFSNGLSALQTSIDLIQSATSTSVSKPAYGACVTNCPVNTYKGEDCVQCPGNQVTASAGATSVTACVCPVGTYGTNGSGVCTPCGQDQTSPQGTQTRSGCVMYCPTGSYASSGTCTVCPYGSSSAGSTSVSACVCASGTFLNAGSCVSQCPVGMYGDNGSRSCIQCPGNQTSTIGAVGVSACVCPDGSGGLNGSGVCTLCTGGQVSTLTTSTCPDDSWTLTGSVCSKVSDYDCTGVSYDDLIESGQLLEPAEIDIGTTSRAFTRQPVRNGTSFTFSLDINIQSETPGVWRDIFQNIPGPTWPIDNTNKRKPSLHISDSWISFVYSTNPGGPPADYNFYTSSNYNVVPGTWFKCTCTVDGPNRTIAMYINGQKQSENTTSGTLALPTDAPAFTWRPTSGNNNGYIKVKNVYWWNQVLSSDAIKLFAGLSVPGACYKTANTCYSTTYTCPTSACTLSRYTCPDASWTLNGSVCLKSGQPMTAPTVTCSCPVSPAQYTCPAGWTQDTDPTRCRTTNPIYYSCQNGGSEYDRNPTSGSTTAKSAWKLEGTRCKRYTCSASTLQTGTYLTIEGNSCKFYNSTYSCASGYRQEPYAGSFQTVLAGIPGCNKWSNVTDDYDVVIGSRFDLYSVMWAQSKTSNFCPPWGASQVNSYQSFIAGCHHKIIDYRDGEERNFDKPSSCVYKKDINTGSCSLCKTGTVTGVQYNAGTGWLAYDSTISRINNILSGTTVCNSPWTYAATIFNPSATYKDQFITKLLDTYRAVPYYTTIPTTLSDDIAATPQYDYRPADPVMGDINADNATLTRTQAQVMAIQTTNATTGSVQGRQCMCPGPGTHLSTGQAIQLAELRITANPTPQIASAKTQPSSQTTRAPTVTSVDSSWSLVVSVKFVGSVPQQWIRIIGAGPHPGLPGIWTNAAIQGSIRAHFGSNSLDYTAGSFTPGVYYNVTMTYDRPTNVMKIYKNGVEAGTSSPTYPAVITPPWGWNQENYTTTDIFVKEVYWFNTALSPTEVATIAGTIAGTYMDLLNKNCATQCPVATYADSATRTCQPCPANTTSPAGSTSSSQCVCSYATPYWTGFSCMQQLNPSAVVTGSGFTTRYENKYTIHEFTQSGSFTLLSPTIAKLLLVGGGAGGSSDGKPGGGGIVRFEDNQSLSGGTYNVTVGAGGGPDSAGGNTSLMGPNTNYTANGGSVLTSLTSSLAFRFINLGASTILYCQCADSTCTPPPPPPPPPPATDCVLGPQGAKRACVTTIIPHYRSWSISITPATGTGKTCTQVAQETYGSTYSIGSSPYGTILKNTPGDC